MSVVHCNVTLSHLPNEAWRKTFGLLMVVLSLMSTFENAVILIILLSNNVMHTPSNRILAALAASDFLTGSVLAPLHAAQLLNHKIMKICLIENIRRYMSAILIGASALTLAIISYDRYLHLVHLHNYRMTKMKLYLLLFFTWLIPCLMPLLRYIKDEEKTYSLVVSVLGLLVLVIIVISYARLMVALNRHRKHSDNEMYHSYMESQHRAGRTVMIVITFYILMFLPTIIAFVLYATETLSVVSHSQAYVIGVFLLLANSAVNPLIYTYRTPELKKFTKHLFGIKPKYQLRRRTVIHLGSNSDVAVVENLNGHMRKSGVSVFGGNNMDQGNESIECHCAGNTKVYVKGQFAKSFN